MKTRSMLIAATLATLFAGSALANAQDASQSMTVDTTAPIRATLLPMVSLDATSATSDSNPARMRVADTAPIEVTLLPTVHVTARLNPELATTLLPTIYVTASVSSESDAIAGADNASMDLPVIDDESASTDRQPLGLRARTMPR
jgi:hypothetical protein